MNEVNSTRILAFMEGLLDTPASQMRKRVARITSNQEEFNKWFDSFFASRNSGAETRAAQ